MSRRFWTLTVIAAVVSIAAGAIGYVQVAVKRIEDELPLRVMQEKRDMEQVARHFYDFLASTEAALAHPTEGNVAAIRDNLNIVVRDLATLRERYTFDTLIGASGLHATMSPAVEDIRIWLTDGFGDLEPTSPIVLELVTTRVRDTLSQVYDKTTEADRVAYEILETQSDELGRLRNRLVIVLALIAALAGIVVWLALRQQRIAQRREAAEAAQSRAQQRLSDALENTSEGFAFFDAGERLVTANRRFRRMFLGAIGDRVVPGASFESIIRAAAESGLILDACEDRAKWIERRLQRFRAPREAFVQQYSDGRWIQINERRTNDGGTVVVYSDITQLKNREIELLKAKEQAEALSEAKSSFLANVSHELRTPLTSILGFARLVQKRLETVILPAVPTGDAKIDRAIRQVRENLDIVLVEGARLTSLVNDVLDLEKIEAGEMVWNIGPFDIASAIEQAAAATESLYRQKGLGFRLDLAPGLPPALGDRDRVVQVLVNLIANAVKFTESGEVACRAAMAGSETLRVSVSDTGCGIAAEDQRAVFEKFRQVGDTLTEKPSGTGLGLPICREIIEHLGGEVTLRSELGRGSTFSFTLPADTEVGIARAISGETAS